MRSMRWAGPVILAAALALAGCGGKGGATDGGKPGAAGDKGGRPAAKLLVIGLDSADWRLLDPMMAEGRLPNLKAFRAQSASGRMQSPRQVIMS